MHVHSNLYPDIGTAARDESRAIIFIFFISFFFFWGGEKNINLNIYLKNIYIVRCTHF